MTAELASTLLSDQYAARVAADLETNTHGQTRIRGEIEALQAQLATLEVDSVLLTLIRDALSSSLPAVTPAKEAAPDRVKPSSKGGPAASSPLSAPRSPAARRVWGGTRSHPWPALREPGQRPSPGPGSVTWCWLCSLTKSPVRPVT